MNLARAFAELELGADLYCLHKNRWWQTSRGPLLDSGAFVAGLEYAAGVEATVLGKPSTAYFEAALEALDAEPALTWMVGDDLETDIAGAQRFGLKTVLVRTGKFRPDALERSTVVPDAVAQLDRVPAGVARRSAPRDRRRRPDRDRADPPRARALPRRSANGASPRPSATTASRGRTRRSTTPRASRARRRSARRSASGSPGRSRGATSRSSGGRSPRCSSRGGSREWAERRAGSPTLDLSMTHSRELAAAVCVADKNSVGA